MPKVLVVGDVIDDVIVVPHGPIRPDTDTISDIRSSPGGSAGNTASWLGHLGVEVEFVGMVGSTCLECAEPAAEAREFIRRQLGNGFGDVFDFHVVRYNSF